VPASQVVGLTSATPIEGEAISMAIVNGTVVVPGSSKVIAIDIKASNGVIHVIDSVLLPPSIASAMAACWWRGSVPHRADAPVASLATEPRPL